MKRSAPFVGPGGARAMASLAAVGLLAGLSAVPSCGGGDAKRTGATSDSTPEDGGVVGECKAVGAANEVAPGDENEHGQCQFLYEAWGTEVLDDWPPTEFMLGLLQKEPTVFGAQFETFGFLPDPNDDLPIGFKRGLVDPTRVHETCALCHVGKLPDGRLWFGLPNGDLDIGRFRVEVNKRWTAAGNPSLLTALGEQKSLELGPGRVDAESGDYPISVPADFPPYFTLGKRTHMNYLGTGGEVRTEVYFSIYTFGAGSPNAETAKVPFPTDDRIDTFLAFFGALAPPPAPAQDAALVAKGKAVYEAAKCGSCHHPEDVALDDVVTYDADPAGKERLPGEDPAFPRGSIRTDIFHRALLDDTILPDGGAGGGGAGGSDAGGGDTGYVDLIKFVIDHHLSVAQTDGYRTNDLRGLWATAPYLHNGSVPTLDDLLKKASDRPATWMRGGFLLDTATPGNGNEGHEFGVTLSDADKQALVAYLKSL